MAPTVLEGLGTVPSRSVGSPSNQRGVHHPLECRSPASTNVPSPSRIPIVPREPREVTGFRVGSQGDVTEGCHRTSVTRGPRLLQPPVFGPEALRNMETSLGRISSQSFCKDHQVFHGDPPVGSGGHLE